MQSRLRPSQGGKFHKPVVPPVELQRQAYRDDIFRMQAIQENLEMWGTKFISDMDRQRSIENAQIHRYLQEFYKNECRNIAIGSKQKEVIKDGKKFIVYSA